MRGMALLAKACLNRSSLAIQGTAAVGVAIAPARLHRSYHADQRLVQNAAFHPDQADEIVAAVEGVLIALGLIDRTDPITRLVAENAASAAIVD